MNSNTIVDALREAGVATETALTLTNPGGNNPWLFVLPASSASNAGTPCILEVPCVPGEAVEISGDLAGGGDPNGMWYADGSPFWVRALGKVDPNATGKTLKIYLYAGNGEPSSSA